MLALRAGGDGSSQVEMGFFDAISDGVPLRTAAKEGDLATLTRLVEEGVDLNGTDCVSAAPPAAPPAPPSPLRPCCPAPTPPPPTACCAAAAPP